MRKFFSILLAALTLGLGALVLLRSPAPSPRFQAPSQEGRGEGRKVKLEIPVPAGAHKYFSGDFDVSLDFGPRDIGPIFLGAPKARGTLSGGVITAEFLLDPEVETSLKGRPIWVRPLVYLRDVILTSSPWAVSWEKVKLGRARGPQSYYHVFNSGSGSAECDRANGELALDVRVTDAAKKHIKPTDEFAIYLLEIRCGVDGGGGRPCDTGFLDRVGFTGKKFLDADYRFKVNLKSNGAPGTKKNRFWGARICGPGRDGAECVTPSAYLGSKVYPELIYTFQWEAGRVPMFCGSAPIAATVDVFGSSGTQ